MKEDPLDARVGDGGRRETEDRGEGARWDGVERRKTKWDGVERRKSPWAVDPSLPKSQEELHALVKDIVDQRLGGGQRGPRLRRFWMPVATAVVVLLSGLGWALWPRGSIVIPDGMVGLWTTAEPLYADRAFRITKNVLTIHSSPQDSTVHSIVRVRAKGDEHGANYTVYYPDFGEESEFSFLYAELPERTIKLLNQPEMTWTKQPS